MKTNKAGSTATINFNGTGISIFGAKRANHGLYKVNLDGQDQEQRNGSDKDTFQFALWDTKGLSQGFHTAVITNLEDKFLDIDFVRQYPALEPF